MRRPAVLVGKGIYEGITRIVEWYVALSLAVMVYLVFAQVIARYFLHISTPTYEELATLLMVTATFLGGGLAVRRQSHITIRILETVIKSKKVIAFVDCLITAVWMAFCVWFTYLAYGFVVWARGMTFYFTALRTPPMWVFYASTFVGGIVFSFYLSVLLIDKTTHFIRVLRGQSPLGGGGQQ